MMHTTGIAVRLDAVVSGVGESPWNVLAYAVALQGRGDVSLTRADFDQCVANFSRWGREVPVVLYHADTDAMAHPLSREAHAWITSMRVGSMRRDGGECATLEARFRWVNTETRASVERGALAYGSVTVVQHGVDEESGADIGSFLWSFSLTNNPALVDIPRIAAEREAPAVQPIAPPEGGAQDSASLALPMPRGLAPASLQTESIMSTTFITLAARLGIACTDEGAAQQQVLARAEESLPVRRQLGLTVEASGKDVSTRIDALIAAESRVTALAAELEALKVIEADRAAREVAAHVDALCVDPSMGKARVALEAFARADYAAFSKAYPRPAAGAASTLMQRVTAPASEAPRSAAGDESHGDRADSLANELMSKDPKLTYAVALARASSLIVKAVS